MTQANFDQMFYFYLIDDASTFNCNKLPSVNIKLSVHRSLKFGSYITSIALKLVSMIRKYHNHILQTSLRHCDEEPQNTNKTSGRQLMQSSQPSLPRRDDCKTRKDTK